MFLDRMVLGRARLLALISLLLVGACARLPWQPESPAVRSADPDAAPVNAPTEPAPPLPTLADHPQLRRNARLVARCARLIGAGNPVRQRADPTNFGNRLLKDAWGRDLPHQPQLIVLHETVASLEGTLAHFQRHNPNDDDQSSYHRVVDTDGSIFEVVPDAKRAYGAGQAAFGDFTLVSRPGRSPSVNNVALHVSLVSPPDGRGDGDVHSGYTAAQYRALARQVLLWQASYGIPLARLTTHEAIDRSRSRSDPRSFSWAHFIEAHDEAAGICGWKNLTKPL